LIKERIYEVKEGRGKERRIEEEVTFSSKRGCTALWSLSLE
jgi:hypothetical protein